MTNEKIICPKCNGEGLVMDDRALGKRMRQVRLDAGMSLRETAKNFGFSASYVSDLELGRRHWNTVWMHRYDRLFGKLT